MKAVKKYLAVMMTILMIGEVLPATVYASTSEGDLAEEIWDAVEAAPVPELEGEIGPEEIETITEVSEVNVEAVLPEDSSAPDIDGSSEAAAGIIEEEPSVNVGAGVQVGDGVTATFDPDTGAVVFFAEQVDYGTLWIDWISKSGFQRDEIRSISISGWLRLPADSSYLFRDLTNLVDLDIPNIETTNVTDMSGMFYNCRSLTNMNLSSFDTEKVAFMHNMFRGCSSLTSLNLSSFDTSNVQYMMLMFSDCSSLRTLSLKNFDLSSVTKNCAIGMFNGCTALKLLQTPANNSHEIELPVSLYNNEGAAYTELPIASQSTVLAQNRKLLNGTEVVGDCVTAAFNSSTGDLNFYSDNGTLWARWLFTSGFQSDKIKAISPDSLVYLPSDSISIFRDCNNLTELDLSSFNTTNVTDMSYMFYGCSKLTDLDLSNFDTSNVTEMAWMFIHCNSLTNLNLSSFNTSKVTNMELMFKYCNSLTSLDLSSFDTSSVTEKDDMLYGCTNLEILVTPKKNSISDIELPLTMYDTAGKKYTNLPVLSKSIVLGKTQKIAQDFLKKPISECTITLKPTSYTYDGTSKKPAVTVKDGTKVLTSWTDYTVAYSKNKNAGKAVVTITASETGDYKGTATVNFTIRKAEAGLVFAESSITKKTTDAAFSNPLTKATTAETTFTSSNTSVATIDSATGMVTLKAAGITTITASAKAATNYNAGTATYTLTVEKTLKGFSDVQDPLHPYYNAIYWAAETGITKGYDDGTFGIDRNCTRGEMMMFLWRYAGKPAPKAVSKSPFKDVPMTHAFYKAILWGSQKGITKGYPDGTFGIDRNVSRGECMMFLWRLKGKPAPKPAAVSPFKDVPKTHAFYNAILWGSQKKITNGYTSGPKKGNFGINDNCTRGQIVTFLYRAK